MSLTDALQAAITAGIGSASWLEIAWTLIALRCLTYVVLQRRFTRRQERGLHRAANYDPAGPRAELLAVYKWREAKDAVLCTGLLLLGCVGLVTPPPAARPNVLAAGLSAGVFLAWELFFLVATAQELRHRVRARSRAGALPALPEEMQGDPHDDHS